jgi:hypothetical protein
MKVKEKGHVYELDAIGNSSTHKYEPETLTFVNKEPGTEHGGTTTQEVIRALIDRTMHCDLCLGDTLDEEIIYHLRHALVLHEARALIRKVVKGELSPELVNVSPVDQHFAILRDGTRSSDAVEWEKTHEPKDRSPKRREGTSPALVPAKVASR